MGILPISETSAGSRCHEEREYGGDRSPRQPALANAGQIKASPVALANARIDIHVHADSLLRYNSERVRLRADTLRDASFHIQNIIARGQG